MDSRDPVEVLAEEFVALHRNGERPSIEEYANRYPDVADQIRGAFGVLLVLEDVAAEEDADDEDGGIDLASGDESQRLLGDYRVISEIGRGGMGIVYEAEQISLGRHVALKVLPKQSLLHPKQRKRFDREARAAAQLHHTNIVPVFGIGEHQGTHYYVMQYIQGRSLHEVMRDLKHLAQPDDSVLTSEHREDQPTAHESPCPSEAMDGEASSVNVSESENPPGLHSRGTDSLIGPTTKTDEAHHDSRTTAEQPMEAVDTKPHHLSDTFAISGAVAMPWHTDPSGRSTTTDYWQSVAHVGIQVAEALDYAHTQGVSHRDIKPGNLLLDTKGTVWITDFGLAKADDQEDLTNTGDVIGTLRYMAPESFDGKGDSRSDIYSLGLTLYELLAFRPAFEESDRKRLIRRIADDQPRSLRKIDSHIPRDLETIVNKASDKDPRRRYQHAGELAEDLRRFVNDEPIRARRASIAERAWRWCRRNPGISWTTAVAAVLIMVTVVGAFTIITKEKNAAVRLANEKTELAAGERAAKEELAAALAREAEQRQLAEEAAEEAKAVANFLLLETYGAASPGRSRVQELTVRNLLDWSVARIDELFDGQPTREAAVRDAIGRAYDHLGLYDKAYEQLSSALEIRRRLLGPDNLATLRSTNAVARVLNEQAKFSEARPLLEKAVERLRKVAGPEHQTTLNAINDLALSLHGLGKYKESQELSQQALETQKKTLGSGHRDTLASMNTLAMCLHSQGDYAGAQVVLTESLDVLRRVFGPEHQKTLTAMANLAASYSGQRDYPAAERAFAECLETFRRVLGPDHPTTLAITENLAATLQYQAKHDQAEALIRTVLKYRQATLGENHWRTANAKSQLGASLTALGRHEEAESLLISGYESMVTVSEAPTFNVRLALQRIVQLYKAWDKPEEAAVWRNKTTAMRTSPASKD